MQHVNSNSSLALPSGAAFTVQRLASIDIYRGLVMFLMLAETLHLSGLAEVEFTSGLGKWLAERGFWNWLRVHTTHVAWSGCSLHDLIQPSFTFLVGVALPFSLRARTHQHQSPFQRTMHALWRSLVLVGLGIFLRSLADKFEHTNFTFDDTLTQIGLGYFFLFLIAQRGVWLSWLALGGILIGYGVAFGLYPLPSEELDLATRGVPAGWEHWYQGFASHWNKNVNLASDVDRWFLNLFPRPAPFEFHPGGYATLSFIPTLGTMIIGLIVGRWMMAEIKPMARTRRMVGGAIVAMAAAWMLDNFGVCPVVKRIWTPSWVLWSGGICMWWMWGLHQVCDRMHRDRWGFAWKVIGANSIVAYVMEWTMGGWLAVQFKKHLYLDPAASRLGPEIATSLIGMLTLLVFWLILYWLYRRKIFVKI